MITLEEEEENKGKSDDPQHFCCLEVRTGLAIIKKECSNVDDTPTSNQLRGFIKTAQSQVALKWCLLQPAATGVVHCDRPVIRGLRCTSQYDSAIQGNLKYLKTLQWMIPSGT